LPRASEQQRAGFFNVQRARILTDVPLDETPNLVSLLVRVEHAVIAELYHRLAREGFPDLTSSSAAIFQFIRPGGSSIDELARLAQLSPAAVREQTDALADAGYVRLREDGGIELTPRGATVVQHGQRALHEIERGWEKQLGSDAFSAFVSALARLNLAPIRR
jgi:DNA-binding transcriptional ArsR family regulator